MNAPQDQPQGPWAPPSAPGAPTGPTLPPIGVPRLPPASAGSPAASTPPSGSGASGSGASGSGASGSGVPPIEPPVPVMTLDAEGGGGRKRSKGALVGAVVGVTALVAAGAFAVVQIGGNDDQGGAASAEEVGTQLTAALDNEDVLGVIDLLLPGERDTFRDPMVDMVDNLRRLEVLSLDADLSKIGGLDIQFTDVTVREEPTNVDDIANIYLSGASSVSVDGASVPLGDLLLDELFDGDRPDMDQPADSAEFDDTKLTVVERDGRWYLSLFYSVAESVRGDDDIPTTGIEPVGGDSPEDALDTMFAAISDLDLEATLAVLDPTEAEALHRYAPLFLDEAQDEIDSIGLEWGITDTEYEVRGEGDRRTVAVTALTFQASVPDEGEVRVEVRDGCLTATFEGDEEKFCEDDLQAGALEDIGVAGEGTQAFLDTVEEAFSDLEPSGIAVHEVDGQWYVSPLRSYFDILNDLLGALDAQELRDLIDTGTAFAEEVVDDFGGPFGLPFDDGSGDDFGFDEGMSGDDDALSQCYMLSDSAAAVACMNEGIAAGTIDRSFVPAHFRFPECGVAEVYFDRIYEMSDAEFAAMAEAASPCFLALIESGAVEAWEVAGELIAPACLEGRNWYTDFDSDFGERFFDCTFAAQEALG